MKKTILVFGLLILALLLLFQFSKYSIYSGSTTIEIIISVIAIVFFVIGVFINKKYQRSTESLQDKIDYDKINALEITTREYEVLQHISEGLSNKEIAAKLFVSESTVKTHVSNLLLKLNAKRRTQAVQFAKNFRII
ncbi:helix-turn-helix transcriptional regulator [Winogradskyella sp. PC-19]|uniref:response regulator transcription factor n=1 Tax=unclassified Winogradskyella TaxID=2615021 RepID=UPI000B3BDFB7|nr:MULTISPECIES: response regulator transcription factor [unclassified Winogradskyella]ARV09901.1 helix-turn-helix transcriptional regulator [Winogradskyella sp. PC-19]RZN84438.1 MAG: response regulator transcription factor [Winogradskyella sp.]